MLVSLFALESHVSVQCEGDVAKQFVKQSGVEAHLRRHVQQVTHPSLKMVTSPASKNRTSKEDGGRRIRVRNIRDSAKRLEEHWKRVLKANKGKITLHITYGRLACLGTPYP